MTLVQVTGFAQMQQAMSCENTLLHKLDKRGIAVRKKFANDYIKRSDNYTRGVLRDFCERIDIWKQKSKNSKGLDIRIKWFTTVRQ